MKGSTYKHCPCPLEHDANGRRRPCRKPHGTWYYVADLGPGFSRDRSTGERTWKLRRQQRKGGFRTQREAEAALADLLSASASGTHAHDERLTVAAFLASWIDAKAASGLRPTTERAYRQHIRDYLTPRLGHLRLRDLRPLHVEGALAQILADNERAVSGATVRRIHATLRSALTDAKRKHLVSINAAKDIALPRAERPKVRPWEPAELGKFLDHAVGADPRLGPMLEVMAATGLRRGEACALRWDDVDAEQAHLVVRRQLTDIPGEHACPFCDQTHRGRRFAATKTASGDERTVDLDSGTVGVLLALRLTQETERAAWGEAYRDHGLVFAREDGTPLDPSAVSKRHAELARAAGVRHVRLHDLRHGAASLRLAANVPLAVVSKQLGHSSLTITADTYSHLLAGVGREASQRAADMVPRASRDNAVTTEALSGLGSECVEDIDAGQMGGPPGDRTPNPRIKS